MSVSVSVRVRVRVMVDVNVMTKGRLSPREKDRWGRACWSWRRGSRDSCWFWESFLFLRRSSYV